MSALFTLSKIAATKTVRKHYLITTKKDSYLAHSYLYTRFSELTDVDYVRFHFDPAGNREVGHLTWKFNSGREAKDLLTIALIKWGHVR